MITFITSTIIRVFLTVSESLKKIVDSNHIVYLQKKRNDCRFLLTETELQKKILTNKFYQRQ